MSFTFSSADFVSIVIKGSKETVNWLDIVIDGTRYVQDVSGTEFPETFQS